MSNLRQSLIAFRSAMLVLLCSISISGCIHRPGLQAYTGQWVLKDSGKNMMVLNTKIHHRRIRGSLTLPKNFTENDDGKFQGIGTPIITRPIIASHLRNGSLELIVGPKADWERIPMTLLDSNHALLNWSKGRVPDWRFERVSTTEKVAVATDWHK